MQQQFIKEASLVHTCTSVTHVAEDAVDVGGGNMPECIDVETYHQTSATSAH